KDKTERLIIVSRGGRDVTVPQAVNVTTLEPGRGSAKDEIDMAGNVAIFEVLAATIEENCVLPTEKATASKKKAVAIPTNRQRLADRPRRVLKSYVFKRDIVGIDLRRRRAKGRDDLTVTANHVRM